MSVKDDARAFAKGCVFLEDGKLVLVWSPLVQTWDGGAARFEQSHVDTLRKIIEGTYLFARRAKAGRSKR